MKKSIKLFSTVALSSLLLVGVGAGTAKSVKTNYETQQSNINSTSVSSDSLVGTGDVTTPEGIVVADKTVSLDFGNNRVYDAQYIVTLSTWIADPNSTAAPYYYETTNALQIDVEIKMPESYTYQNEDHEKLMLIVGPELKINGQDTVTADSFILPFSWVADSANNPETSGSFYLDTNDNGNTLLSSITNRSALAAVDMNYVIRLYNDPTADYNSGLGVAGDTTADGDGNDYLEENTKEVTQDTVNPADYVDTNPATYYSGLTTTPADMYLSSSYESNGTLVEGQDGKIDSAVIEFTLHLNDDIKYWDTVGTGDNDGKIQFSGYLSIPYYDANGEITAVYTIDWNQDMNNISYSVSNPDRDNTYDITVVTQFQDEVTLYIDQIGGEMFIHMQWYDLAYGQDFNQSFDYANIYQGASDIGTAGDGNKANGELNYSQMWFNVELLYKPFNGDTQVTGNGVSDLWIPYKLITDVQLNSQSNPLDTTADQSQVWWILTIIWGTAFVVLAGGIAYYAVRQAKETKEILAFEKEQAKLAKAEAKKSSSKKAKK